VADIVCTVCRSRTAGKVVFTEFGIDVIRCPECRHVMSSYQADQNYDEYFDQPGRLETFWWDRAHRQMYEDFCRYLLPARTGRLLDVGAGLGYFVRTITRESNWEAYGCEISAGAVEYAKEVLGLTSITCGKLEEAGYRPSSFDLITLWDVIEHIPDPDLLLTQIGTLLKPGGGLFLHTPNALVQLVKAQIKKAIKGERVGNHYLEARDHVNLYSVTGITRVLERCGFKDVQFQHLSPIQSVSGSDKRILRIAKNGYFLAARTLSWMTSRKINLDNLFVTATKN
jgi:2-polyprenyl-3-methyl-5-hydroxy-6-metoxy-1,4-benzoquinol methylase